MKRINETTKKYWLHTKELDKIAEFLKENFNAEKATEFHVYFEGNSFVAKITTVEED